ncbi:ArnT family glycosyltransferase [Oscillatoria salina]|uniref:ArnT family glycosyltransferase n=1 Tax=Oscillatoria salina TaxID=331517 RepID=UPI0013BC1497|nr:glycosyltransferase family 39 protein [Oscillatoria salina]MBZ8178697.1 glycosyltransferase family 39 protein [Oscillatoria salina IIICB1]NET88277.1 glycosyltransferase family 39 protein [Kamptonema sp. SIO1D9]
MTTIRHLWKSFEQYPQAMRLFSLVWLLFLSWLAFLWHLGNTGLVDETEPLFAEAARQMTETGDWITPYFNGETRFDKPPLVYWLMAIGYKLIGVNEWAVRLPSALAAIALMFLAFYTLRRFGFPIFASPTQTIAQNQRQLWLSAWLGAAFIALNPQTIVWARTGVSDMLLNGCMSMALLCFFVGYATQENVASDSPKFRRLPNFWYLAFYVLISLAVLTKGPVGLVLPGLIILSFLLYLGKFREVVAELKLFWGIPLFLLITVPWYVLVIWRNGQDYINSFFGYHNFERFTGVVNGHDAPWYFYFLVVLIGFIPWSIYLPLAIASSRFWRRSIWRRQPRSRQLGLFAFFWFTAIFVFFTIAVTKLPSYVIPLLPAAAILVALLWSDLLTQNQEFVKKKAEQNHHKNRGLLISGIVNIAILLILAAVFLYSPNLIGYDPAAKNLPELYAESGLPIKAAIIWTAVAIAGLILLRHKQNWRWLWSVNLIGFVLFFIFVLTPVSFLVDRARQLPLREMSAAIAEIKQPEEELLMIGFKKPSIVFYSQQPVTFLSKTERAKEYLAETSSDSYPSENLLILTQLGEIKETDLQPDRLQILETTGSYQLIRTTRENFLENAD